MFDDLLKNLPSHAVQTKRAMPGQTLFRQGQPCAGIFKVISGTVFLRRTTPSGDMLIVHRASAGDYFAEASIFSDTYHCDALCVAESQVIRYAHREIHALMRQDTTFAWRFAQHLAVQVQQYRAHAEIVAIRSARNRILAAVQANYLQGTVTELAQRINLTHEACYRGLRALCKEGRLRRIGRGRYVLSEKAEHV